MHTHNHARFSSSVTHTLQLCQFVFLLGQIWTLTSTVSEAVQDVALVAQALKAARVVDAGVVAGSLKGALVDVCGRTKRYPLLRNTVNTAAERVENRKWTNQSLQETSSSVTWQIRLH